MRRAGFAYRRSYDSFLKRYKSLCPKTWPNYQGSAKEGVNILTQHLGYTKQEFSMGKYAFVYHYERQTTLTFIVGPRFSSVTPKRSLKQKTPSRQRKTTSLSSSSADTRAACRRGATSKCAGQPLSCKSTLGASWPRGK